MSTDNWTRERNGWDATMRDCGILAEFANLGPSGIEDFRRKHRGFLPDAWWSVGPAGDVGQGSVYIPWQREQDRLRKAWVAAFHADKVIELVTTSLFLMAHALEHDDAERVPQKVWPYQRAIMFLHVHSTRARICEQCEKRFVSETKAKFCPFGTIVDGIEMSCFAAHRKGYKNDWWKENKGEINPRRKREYKPKRSRAHANRKNLRQK